MRCSRAFAVLAPVVVLTGCLSGHLLDLARRRQMPVAVTRAWLAGETVVLEVEAVDTNDAGENLGRRSWSASVPIGVFRGATPWRVDRVPVEVLAELPVGAEPLPIVDGKGDEVAHGTRLAVEREGDTLSVLRLEKDDVRGVVLYPNALVRQRIEPWVIPLLPVTGAIDLVTTPMLLMTAPAVISVGD